MGTANCSNSSLESWVAQWSWVAQCMYFKCTDYRVEIYGWTDLPKEKFKFTPLHVL